MALRYQPLPWVHPPSPCTRAQYTGNALEVIIIDKKVSSLVLGRGLWGRGVVVVIQVQVDIYVYQLYQVSVGVLQGRVDIHTRGIPG